MSKPNVAIVLGGGITGLGLIRNLSANGVDVYCVVDRKSAASYSKLCKKIYNIASCQSNNRVLESFLNGVNLECNKAVIIPSTDLFSIGLSEIKGNLNSMYLPIVADKQVIKKLAIKSNFYASLSSYDLPYPVTYHPMTKSEAAGISDRVNYPVFLKPSETAFFQQAFNLKGFVANSKQELVYYYSLASNLNLDVVVQEIIPGPENSMYSLAGFFDRDYTPKALFACRRLRGWPPHFGVSSSIESVRVEDLSSVKDKLLSYLGDIGYYGIMEAEFKFDARDGLYKLIEINARSWWQNTLPTACGLNIVYSAFLDAIGIKSNYCEKYKTGVNWVNFELDLASLRESHGSILEWVRCLRRAEAWAYFSPFDVSLWIKRNRDIVTSRLKNIHTYQN